MHSLSPIGRVAVDDRVGCGRTSLDYSVNSMDWSWRLGRMWVVKRDGRHAGDRRPF